MEVPVIPDFDCDAAYGGDGVYIAVFPSMVCAGDTVTSNFRQHYRLDEHKDIDQFNFFLQPDRIPYCQGDSGGPLFTGTGETAVQHGIVSWGQACTYSQFPGKYPLLKCFIELTLSPTIK